MSDNKAVQEERLRIARYLAKPRAYQTEPDVKLPSLIPEPAYTAEMEHDGLTIWDDWTVRLTVTKSGRKFTGHTMTKWGAIWWAHAKKRELQRKERLKDIKPIRINL